jgi:hypothetical protein
MQLKPQPGQLRLPPSSSNPTNALKHIKNQPRPLLPPTPERGQASQLILAGRPRSQQFLIVLMKYYAGHTTLLLSCYYHWPLGFGGGVFGLGLEAGRIA